MKQDTVMTFPGPAFVDDGKSKLLIFYQPFNADPAQTCLAEISGKFKSFFHLSVLA